MPSKWLTGLLGATAPGAQVGEVLGGSCCCEWEEGSHMRQRCRLSAKVSRGGPHGPPRSPDLNGSEGPVARGVQAEAPDSGRGRALAAPREGQTK